MKRTITFTFLFLITVSVLLPPDRSVAQSVDASPIASRSSRSGDNRLGQRGPQSLWGDGVRDGTRKPPFGLSKTAVKAMKKYNPQPKTAAAVANLCLRIASRIKDGELNGKKEIEAALSEGASQINWDKQSQEVIGMTIKEFANLARSGKIDMNSNGDWMQAYLEIGFGINRGISKDKVMLRDLAVSNVGKAEKIGGTITGIAEYRGKPIPNILIFADEDELIDDYLKMLKPVESKLERHPLHKKRLERFSKVLLVELRDSDEGDAVEFSTKAQVSVYPKKLVVTNSSTKSVHIKMSGVGINSITEHSLTSTDSFPHFQRQLKDAGTISLAPGKTVEFESKLPFIPFGEYTVSIVSNSPFDQNGVIGNNESKADRSVKLLCLPSPLVALTDENGRFTIEGVPEPGSGLTVWDPVGRFQNRSGYFGFTGETVPERIEMLPTAPIRTNDASGLIP